MKTVITETAFSKMSQRTHFIHEVTFGVDENHHVIHATYGGIWTTYLENISQPTIHDIAKTGLRFVAKLPDPDKIGNVEVFKNPESPKHSLINSKTAILLDTIKPLKQTI